MDAWQSPSASWIARPLLYAKAGHCAPCMCRLLAAASHQCSICCNWEVCGLWQETLDGYLFHEWEHYQMSKEDVEIRREGDRDRQSRLRMSRRDSSVTPSGLQKESGRGGEGSGEVVISFNKEEKFDEFWAAFPAKKDKAAAKKSWAKLQPLDHDAAIAGASAYSSWLSQHPDPPSVKYPQGWLTGRRWEDELKPVRSKASSERMNEFQRQMQAAKKIDETRLELEE